MTGAMLWKELREIMTSEGRPAVQLLMAGIVDVVFGIAMPVLVAHAVYASLGLWPTIGILCAGVVGLAAFMGIIGPMPTIADAFAGERERHTLETLLAGPIPDAAILRGKMGAQYAVVGSHVALVSLAAGVTSGVLIGLPGLLVLPVGLLGGALAAFVTSSFVIGIGVLLSLRAPTVKKAQERLGYVMMPFFLLPGIVPSLLRGHVGGPLFVILLAALGPTLFVGGAIVSNVLVFARFRRDRLVGLG